MTKAIAVPKVEGPLTRSHAAVQAALARGRVFVVGLLTLAIRVYQLTLSPAQTFLFGAGAGCRYTPTCSAYAVEAVRAHGALRGTRLAAHRICRCHPWGGCGHDPVPPPSRGARPD